MAQHNVPCETHLVLLADVAHVEELLVVEGEKLSRSVNVGEEGYGRHRPPDELL